MYGFKQKFDLIILVPKVNIFLLFVVLYPPKLDMSTQSDFAQLLEKSQELNLKYKTKIIELENELNHERTKARQYENKFKDALLQSQFSQGQELIEKLNSKEKQLFDCRKQIIELNRRIANASNSPSQNDLMALAQENQELMANIEEIKSAAINAIMMKEQQIEQLNKNIAKYDHIESQLKFQYQKYESLERQFEVCMNEKAEEIRELTQKLARQREVFLNRLQAIQKQSYQEQSYKVKLEQKAQDLEGTIEKSQMLIADYENRIQQLESQISQQKFLSQQEKLKFEIETDELKEEIKQFERQERTLTKTLEDWKNKERNAQQTIAKLNEKNEQLNHKLSMKKKKQNKIIKDKITSSFAGVAKANPVYASFAFRAKDSIVQEQDDPKHLGDFPQLQQMDGLIQNFNFQDLGAAKAEEIPNDVPITHIMTKKKANLNNLVSDVSKNQPSKVEVKSPAPQQTSTNLSYVSNAQNAKEIESYKQTIIRIEAQKKELQINLNDAYNQMQRLNQTISTMSGEIQQERKNISELRQQMKKTKKQAQLLVQVQSLTLHVQKLENDMVASKLKYAEEADFAREKHNRERVIWTQKLVKLTEQLAKQDLQISPKPEQKKKKKGFFG